MLVSVEFYTLIVEENGYLKGRNTELEKQIKQYNEPVTLEEVEEMRNQQCISIPEAEYRELIAQKGYAEGRIEELKRQLEELKRPIETATKGEITD